MEFQRLGTPADGPARHDLLDLSRPCLDFVAIARGMGVPASRADTAEGLTTQLRQALSEPGPHLIEAVVPALF
jgi:acetolactate synthase-1/2/3 large subunit